MPHTQNNARLKSYVLFIYRTFYLMFWSRADCRELKPEVMV